MSYLAIKHLHIGCATLSIALFSLRGVLQVRGIAWRRWRVLRIAPHVNDSILLGAAIWMTTQLPPDASLDWIGAKIAALLAYILCGKFALSDATSASRRLPFLLLAFLSVGYIVGTALTHSPSWGLIAPSSR
jgi:uncharacterized membrane protein SirB2